MGHHILKQSLSHFSKLGADMKAPGNLLKWGAIFVGCLAVAACTKDGLEGFVGGTSLAATNLQTQKNLQLAEGNAHRAADNVSEAESIATCSEGESYLEAAREAAAQAQSVAAEATDAKLEAATIAGSYNKAQQLLQDLKDLRPTTGGHLHNFGYCLKGGNRDENRRATGAKAAINPACHSDEVAPSVMIYAEQMTAMAQSFSSAVAIISEAHEMGLGVLPEDTAELAEKFGFENLTDTSFVVQLNEWSQTYTAQSQRTRELANELQGGYDGDTLVEFFNHNLSVKNSLPTSQGMWTLIDAAEEGLQGSTEAVRIRIFELATLSKDWADDSYVHSAEATRNGWLAIEACGGYVPEGVSDELSNPFEDWTSQLPEWDSTFWDISSP